MIRTTPQEYFQIQENNYNGVILGALIVLLGVVVGGMLVYFAMKSKS